MPTVCYLMFQYVEDDLDQFSYMANICLVLGAMTSILFLVVINEPTLIAESKAVWEKRLIGDDDLSPFKDIDNDDNLFTEESEDKKEELPHFGDPGDVEDDIFLLANLKSKMRQRYTELDRFEDKRRYNTPIIERRALS